MSNNLKKRVLTREEWQNALRCASPHRNKKKYYRKEKHGAADKGGSSFLIYL